MARVTGISARKRPQRELSGRSKFKMARLELVMVLVLVRSRSTWH